MRDLVDRAWDYSVGRLQEAGGSIYVLAEPLQTVLAIYAAQGIIDNGGLEYFFESDFDDSPPYEYFVKAFRRVGAEHAADCIETAAKMFPFSNPHLYESKRRQWLESIRDHEGHQFKRLSNAVCGDSTAFLKLVDYVERNRHAFGPA